MLVQEKEMIEGKEFYFFIKRTFDIVFSLLALPFVIIIVLIMGIFIKLDSKGPVIYTQKRLGLNEQEFEIFKLRSMDENAEEETGAVWAEKDDPRVTKVGKFMRKYRIDELPQFFNVLIGNMSLIGPRPERKDLTEEFEQETPGFKKRLLVKPGITGLAQVNGGYDIPYDQKLIYDMEYIQTMSIWNDIKIIFKTVLVIIVGHGAR